MLQMGLLERYRIKGYKKGELKDLNEDINFYRTVMDFAADGRD